MGRATLYHELINFLLDRLNLLRQLFILVGDHAYSNDGAGDTAGPAECGLGRNEDVRDVLTTNMSMSWQKRGRRRTFSSQRRGR